MITALVRKLHPVYRLRRYAAGRALLRQFDGEVWLRPDQIAFPIRARRIQHSGISHDYELRVAKVFAEILHDREIGSFWDVGANIGFYSWLVKTLRPDVQVEAFEPDPRNVALMLATIERAGVQGVTVNQIALGDKSGVAQFSFDDVSGLAGCISESDQYSLARTTYGCTRRADVSISTIDQIRSERGRRISFVKIDVEGHEAAVIRGGLNTLALDKPSILIECLTETYPSVAKLLSEVGYSMSEVDAFNFMALPIVSV